MTTAYSAEQLFAREPVHVDHQMHWLVCTERGSCFPDVSWELHGYQHFEVPDIDVRFIKQHVFDGRREWTLATVWWRGRPFMIAQAAGREGDDWRCHWVTDPQLYEFAFQRIVATLWALKCAARKPVLAVADLTTVNRDYTTFYGNSLDGYFEHYGNW